MGKDYKGETVELITSGAEGAFIGIQATRSGVFQLQAGNEITHSSMTDNFMTFESNYRYVYIELDYNNNKCLIIMREKLSGKLRINFC